MNKSDSISNLVKAVLSVMKAVKGIDKSMTVGTGNNTYKGVSDKDVKKIIGEAMAENGLCIFPIEIKPKVQIDRWEEAGNGYTKMKQSVFTEVETKYLICHESDEFIEIAGYGQGVDSQDKGSGKSETYALKCALLYTFLVPTGAIDDADKTHSDDIDTVPIRETILSQLINCETKPEIVALFKKFNATVSKDESLKKAFKERESELLNLQTN